ncbi:hypothetical protein [Streptococcus mitis]|jgi:hypothetical protein|uniref:Uncharacterized protein n=1 Tax=Streptococcus mitis TaxID=28037 RepID=A0A6I1TYI3_STRMT|nr:hypothetical protein [Streptococcus mitis]MQQ30731.1 hypothetical protein [Streptococcus mitis]
MSKLKKDQKEYIAVIHHNSGFPEHFWLGSLSKNEVEIIFGILEIIHNRYSQEGVTISYLDIAIISEYATELYDNNTNNQFERFIESIQTKLRLVSYRQLLGPYEKSDSVFHDYPIFLQFTVDNIDQELTLYVSETVYQLEIKKDKNGNIIEEERRIADLFRKEDWPEIQVYEKVKEGYFIKIEKRK